MELSDTEDRNMSNGRADLVNEGLGRKIPSPRKRALDNFKKMLDAVEEHRSEAEREGNEQWAVYLGVIAKALYDSNLPTHGGKLNITLNLNVTVPQ